MSIPAQIVAFTIVLPALLAGGVLVVAWQLQVHRSLSSRWGSAAAVGIGYVAGHLATLGTPAFPPVEATQWLIYIAIAALALGSLEYAWTDQPWLTWVIRSVFLAAMGWFLLRPLIAYSWGGAQSVGWVLGVAVCALAFWGILEQLGKAASPQLAVLLLIVLGTAQSIAIVVSRSALLAQLQGVLVSTLGAAFVLAWRFPRMRVTVASGIPAITMLSVAHAAGGFFYAELPGWSIACLGLAPVFALVAWRSGEGMVPRLAGFAGALAASAAAVWVAASLQ